MKTRLSKNDRSEFIRVAFYHAFKSRVESLEAKCTEMMKRRLGEEHPEFVRMLAVPELRRYLYVQQGLTMKRAMTVGAQTYHRDALIPAFQSIAEFDAWDKLESDFSWIKGCHDLCIKISHPRCGEDCKLSSALTGELQAEYQTLIDDMRTVSDNLKRIIFSARYREDIEEVAPALACYLPAKATPAPMLPVVIPTESIEKLAALGVPPKGKK